MGIVGRLGVWLICLIGLACFAAPAYNSLRIYHLSYDGMACTANQERDCLETFDAMVVDKSTQVVSDAEGTTTHFYVQTSRGEYEVDEDFYDLVQKDGNVQITTLNGQYVSMSDGQDTDSIGTGQQDNAVFWAMIIGALIIAFSAATFALFAEHAYMAGCALLLGSPITFSFGAIPASFFAAICGGVPGIIVSWVLAAITGVVIAAVVNSEY